MPTSENQIYLIAHNIRSLHNVGSVFRSAESFGVTKLYLTGYTGTPTGHNVSKIAKVALGTEELVPWEKKQSLTKVIKQLQAKGIKVLALENNIAYKTKILPISKISYPIAILLGEETKGITKKILDLVDEIVEIPRFGKKESLNVSVACGIVLYALRTIKSSK